MYIGENKIPENSKRNGFIDFLKFIFAIIILIHHSWQFFSYTAYRIYRRGILFLSNWLAHG